MKEKIQILFIAGFILVTGLVGLNTLDNVNPKSEMEARTLKQIPKLNYQKLRETEYYDTITNGFADQLEWREDMIKSYYNMMVNVLHQNYVGTVTVGSDNELFHEPELITDKEAYEKQVIRSAKIVNKEAKKIAKRGVKFIYINYPKKDVVQSRYLPAGYPDSEKEYQYYIDIMKKNLSDDVIFIDAYEIFKENEGTDYYYKTDHHVNAKGQQLIYEEVLKLLWQEYPDLEKKTLDDYIMTKQIINGSFARKIGYVVEQEPEELNLKPKGWEINYTNTNTMPVFGEENTYASAFMGRDWEYTEIVTDNKKAPSILISGSSYTNALEALILPDVYRMMSVDFRNNKTEDDLYDLVKKKKPDYVIYIPSQSDKMFNYDAFRIHLGK